MLPSTHHPPSSDANQHKIDAINQSEQSHEPCAANALENGGDSRSGLRLLLATIPRKFPTHEETKRQFSTIPYVLSLEILDALPAVWATGLAGIFQAQFRDMLGRFTSVSDRRFILVRRSICLSLVSLSRVMAKSASIIAFRRNLAFLFRSARYITFDNIMDCSKEYNIQKCIEILFSIASKQQSFRVLRAVNICTTIGKRVSDTLATVPPVLIPYIKSLSVIGQLNEEDAETIRRLLNLNRLMIRFTEQASSVLSTVPLVTSNMRHIVLASSRHYGEDELAPLCQRILSDANCLKSILLPCDAQTLSKMASNPTLARLPPTIRQVKDMGHGIESLVPSLRVVVLSFQQQYAVTDCSAALRSLNERGMLTSLSITVGSSQDYEEVETITLGRCELEAMGIGAECCALRSLKITYLNCGKFVPNVDIYVPILKCQYLEHLEIEFVGLKIDETARKHMFEALEESVEMGLLASSKH